jgi:hypothetical protein
MTMPHEAGIVHVHVDNAVKMEPVSTEEHYAEHFTCSTFTLPQGEIIGTGVGAIEPTQILQLDPLRQRAVLSYSGSGQVILAHSVQQATSLAQNVQQAADQGALVTSPATMAVEATGPLWAVGLQASPSQNSNSAHGAITSPTAGQAIATITGANLPAGQYTVSGTVYVDGTVAAADDDNMKLTVGGVTIMVIAYNGEATDQGVTIPPVTVTVNGAQSIALSAVAVGTTGAVYHGTIVATPFPFITTGGGLSVGVTQERRNK